MGEFHIKSFDRQFASVPWMELPYRRSFVSDDIRTKS